VDLVTNKKADCVRVYLPPDADCLLWVTDHCLRTYDRINVIVAGKQPAPQWLAMDEAVKHCDVGIGIWDRANMRGMAHHGMHGMANQSQQMAMPKNSIAMIGGLDHTAPSTWAGCSRSSKYGRTSRAMWIPVGISRPRDGSAVASKQDLERGGITTGSPARQPSPSESPMMNMPGMKH
jgi:hypothetical protein